MSSMAYHLHRWIERTDGNDIYSTVVTLEYELGIKSEQGPTGDRLRRCISCIVDELADSIYTEDIENSR